VRIAELGHCSFDSATGNCEHCSTQHAAHFGLTPAEFIAGTAGHDPELFYIHPDDQAAVVDAIRRIKFGDTMHFEYRGLRKNGDIRHIHEIVEPVFDAVRRVNNDRRGP